MGDTGKRAIVMGLALLSCAGTTVFPAPLHAEESHPGLAAEALYAEALLAIHRKQTEEALKILDEVLVRDPKHIEALELKALTLNNNGKDQEAAETYEKLLKIRPYKEQGPYRFELGTIYQRQKKMDLARSNLEKALGLKFNVTASRFLLGIMAFNANEYRRAELFLNRVAKDGNAEMKVICHYYLGLMHLKTGYPLGATRELASAQREAASIPDNKTASDISASAQQILAPFSASNWFGNFSFLTQYDSNISQIPTGSAPTSGSGKSTPKLSLSGGAGYMSAPIETIQYVASYRLSLNKNLNSETKTYEFVTNTASLYLNYQPLDTTNGGLKLEGNLLFQNNHSDPTDSSSGYVYQKYNLGGEVGPFMRYAATRQIQTQADLYFRPQKFFSDASLNGLTMGGRGTVRVDLYSKYLNPSAVIGYEKNGAAGDDNKCNTLTLSGANGLKLSDKDSVTVGLDYIMAKYPLHSLARSDKMLTLKSSLMHAMSPKWAILADINYSSNSSTLAELYTYNRFTMSGGMSWSL